MPRFFAPAAFAVAASLAQPVLAHGVAGPRIFINNLLIDDQAVADEAAFPTSPWQHFGAEDSGGATNEYDFDFEFDKHVTDNFGVGIDDGYQVEDRKLKATLSASPDGGPAAIVFNDGMENRCVGGLSIQYSLPCLQARVKDLRLPPFVSRLPSAHRTPPPATIAGSSSRCRRWRPEPTA